MASASTSAMERSPPQPKVRKKGATVTSEDPGAEGGSDRRGSARLRTVYRVARVEREKGAGLWRVRNISDGGMMLSARCPVEVGEALTVVLSEAIRIPARVIWCGEEGCGIAFDTLIDSAAVLKALAEERMAQGHRAPRVPVSLRGVLYCEQGIHSIRTTDMSQYGIGFTHEAEHFRPGMRVLVMLENGIERRGIVRWSRDGRAGLQLIEPFVCADLEDIGHA